MEKCVSCGREEDEVRLFDGIYVSEPVKICEKCSLISNIPIIKRPTTGQLKESERPYGVKPRLMNMAGMHVEEKKQKSAYEELRDIENRPELEKPDNIDFRLVDNFHWIMQTTRRRRGLSARQLAESISESESAIKMLEKNILPRGSENLLKKIEQFLNIELIRKDYFEKAIERANKGLPPPFMPKEEEEYMIEEEEKKDFSFNMRNKGGEDMVKQAIKEEKNIELLNIETSEGVPLRASDFRKHGERLSIADLRRATEKVDKDFNFSTKTREQVGEEQMNNFGKEDIEKTKRELRAFGREDAKKKNAVPTIYDLMKKKEERDKQLIGKDIEVVDD